MMITKLNSCIPLFRWGLLIGIGLFICACTGNSGGGGTTEEIDCGEILIDVPNSPAVGDTLNFNASSTVLHIDFLSWQIKDEAGTVIDTFSGLQPRYLATKAGIFKVIVELNTLCQDSTLISVREMAPAEVITGTIQGPSSTRVGEKKSFRYSGNATASELEWDFSETGDKDGDGTSVSYSFQTPGNKTIRVSYKGKILAEKTVIVKPDESVVKAQISEEEIRAKFQGIIEASSGKEKNELYKELKKAMRDENIPVIVNGETFQLYDYFISLSFDDQIVVKSVKAITEKTGISKLEITQE